MILAAVLEGGITRSKLHNDMSTLLGGHCGYQTKYF